MNTSHLDAREIGKPGGLGEGISQGLLRSLQAYFDFKDNQAAGERSMRREERQAGRQQRNDALTLAQNLGVDPAQADSGWLSPGDQAAIAAAKSRFGVAEAQRAQALADAQTNRDFEGLKRRATEMELVKRQGLGVLPPGAQTAEHVKAWQQAQQERALDAARQKLSDEVAQVNLAGAKDARLWNSPGARTLRGVGETVKDWVGKGIEASGRQKVARNPQQEHIQGELLKLRAAKEAGTSYTPPGANSVPVDPDKIPAYMKVYEDALGRIGGDQQPVPGDAPAAGQAQPAAAEDSSARIPGFEQVNIDRGGLNEWMRLAKQDPQSFNTQLEALRASNDPRYAVISAQKPNLPKFGAEDEMRLQADLITKGTQDGKTIGAGRTWKADGSPVLFTSEVEYAKTLPASEQIALTQAMASRDMRVRAMASFKLKQDAETWSRNQATNP